MATLTLYYVGALIFWFSIYQYGNTFWLYKNVLYINVPDKSYILVCRLPPCDTIRTWLIIDDPLCLSLVNYLKHYTQKRIISRYV